MTLSYHLQGEWLGASDAGATLAGLKAEQRLLLLSDGSLTTHLDALFGVKVAVEVRMNSSALLSGDEAALLDEAPGSQVIEREVFLTVDSKRLVFARSLILAGELEGWLESALGEGEEPLGRILEAREIPVLKHGLEIGIIKSPEISAGLGLEPDSKLFARRYKLVNRRDGGGYVIKAALLEVLSPRLVRVL